MSSIESYIGQRSAGTAIKLYSMLDTNEDEVVSPDELVLPRDVADGDLGAGQDIPTTSSAETLADPVAAALLDVHPSADAASIASAVAAYHTDDEATLSA